MRVLNNSFSVLMISLLMQASTVYAEPEAGSLPATFPGSGGFPAPLNTDFAPNYPQWPDRFTRSETIPPPPGGPYMSSAMSGIDAFPANTGGLRDDPGLQQVQSESFRVDMPWPESPERERPVTWMPETGEYHFVPEEVVRELESAAFDRRQERPAAFQPYRAYPPAPAYRQPYYGYR